MTHDASDGELVRAIAAGGPAARAAESELCRRFAPRARLYGLRHLRTEEAARDLAQAALLAVLVAAREGRIADTDQFERFVLGTCRNVASRMRETAARATPTDHRDLDGIDVLADAPDLTRLDASALHRCLSALEARARTVLLLAFHEDRTADEIATALATTAGNVRVMRHRALGQLRRCLDPRPEVTA